MITGGGKKINLKTGVTGEGGIFNLKEQFAAG